MHRASALAAFLAVVFLGLTYQAQGAQQVLVMGDSLTKEYEAEFPALFPSNPTAWLARNWVELLHENRNAHFDLGSFSFYGYPRITGHKYNWAFPGATTQEIRDRLASTSFLDKSWQDEFKNQIVNQVERVVVFAGGNDVEDYYDDIYNGATATTFTNVTEDNLKWIVDTIRGIKSTIPIVLVSVPHVGCTPKVQESCPTNATKTARVTAALDRLNTRLADFASRRGIGFTMEVYNLTKSLITDPFTIGGIEFLKQADMNSRVQYVYSGDGFHPNTCAHAKIAQCVINAFRTTYTSPNIPAAADSELLAWLQMEDVNPFIMWLIGLNVSQEAFDYHDDPDKDGIPNLVEYLLNGMNANAEGRAQVPITSVEKVGGQDMLTCTWNPRSSSSSFATLTLMQSSTLSSWTQVPAQYIVSNSDGSKTAKVPLTGPLFFRFAAVK